MKPSEFNPKASELLAQLVSKYFKEDELAVILGGVPKGAEFTAAPFNHLMFTGGTAVGRHVMRAAAENLTPVTLELGGKCPAIVTELLDVVEAAARTLAVKAYNGGQICVAPDYAYVPSPQMQRWIDGCKAAVGKMFPAGIDTPDYTSVVNDRHFQRMQRLVKSAQDEGLGVIDLMGAGFNRSDRRFPLTLVVNPTEESGVMKEEIFGPILPVFGYDSLDTVLSEIAARENPLGVWLFSRDDTQIRYVLDRTTPGGVTINDVMAHIYPDDVPFGGVGASGFGHYHSVEGFKEFSQSRAVYYQSEIPEVVNALRPPYSDATRKFFMDMIGD